MTTVGVTDRQRPTGEDFFAPVRGRFAVIIALAVLGALMNVVPFIAIAELARTLWPALTGEPVDSPRAWVCVIVMIASLVVSFLGTGGGAMIGHLADNDLQLSLRTRIVRQLRAMPLGWFDARSTGTVKKAVENDVAAIHQLVAHGITDIISATLVPLVSIVYLFIVDWRMALVTLIPLIAAAVIYAKMMTATWDRYAQYDAALERLNAATIEYVHGIAVVKSFGQAGRSHQRFRNETGRFTKVYNDWMAETAIASRVTELVTAPVPTLLLICSAAVIFVNAGIVATPDVVPALLMCVGITAPLMQLGFSAQFMRNAIQAKTSLDQFFAQPRIAYPEHPAQPADASVEFDDVGFSYDGEHTVLHEIAASCRPGTVTALVGPSGSGKTTLARLVPRFYDVDEGSVELGGTDVRQLAADALYRQVGFVFQDAYLLRTTIRDNIRLTRPDADQADVEQAARTAQIHDRILRFPRGYDSVIGQDAHLSGGEAQRLTIARALLTDAPILVLDEATAFADPDSEAAIQTALSALAADRTLLVIAHRLHTITGVDQILVLDEGRIVERGSHDELATAGGSYQSMWERYQAARTSEEALR